MFSFLREAPDLNGKPGPLSARRILAFILAVASLPCYFAGFQYSAAGWVVFIPGIVCQLSALLLLFFTTWADVTGIVQAIRKP